MSAVNAYDVFSVTVNALPVPQHSLSLSQIAAFVEQSTPVSHYARDKVDARSIVDSFILFYLII